MYVLILFLPLFSFIISATLGFFLGRLGSSFLSVFLLGLSFLMSIFIFYEVGLCDIWVHVYFFHWNVLDIFTINFGLLFDNVTIIMLLVVTCISFFVHLYSLEYMGHDPFLNRFISYLSLFTFFMLILVTADNFLQLFIGWEGVGLCSYLLINFWFTRALANKAAIKAMLMNRIADVFFIIAIFFFLFYFGSTDYQLIFSLLGHMSEITFYFFGFKVYLLDFISIFLFLGAIGKSAQLGLHTWLPDAMEGPTPVSALLHAATMVTAGVFLIIRSSPIFEFSTFSLFLIAMIGGMTAFFFSLSAVFQFDLKKVIAYSTCSQLGYMFLACGLSFYNLALFHLFNHAFFKALLFLSAGSIIHALNDEQDMRKMGGLINFLPFVFFCMFFGSLAIMGFPFLTGFYSKDVILELLLASYKIDFLFFYTLALFAAFFTALYSIRLLLLVFFFKPNFFFISFPKESYFFISVSLFSLAFCSLFFGYVFSDLFIGLGSFFWSQSIAIFPLNGYALDTLLLSPFQKNLPLFFSLLGWVLGMFFFFFMSKIYLLNLTKINFFRLLWYKILNNQRRIASFFYFAGYFNVLYNYIFVEFYKASYYINTKLVDKGFLEFLGPVGIYRFLYSLSRKLWIINSSIFLNIGFMVFALIFFYLFGIIYNSMFIFSMLHYGLFFIGFLLISNEFIKIL